MALCAQAFLCAPVRSRTLHWTHRPYPSLTMHPSRRAYVLPLAPGYLAIEYDRKSDGCFSTLQRAKRNILQQLLVSRELPS